MPIVSTKKMTARQFFQLGEDPPGVRLELVNGEVAVSASPLPQHSLAVIELSGILRGHIREHGLGILLGDVDTVFGEFDVRRPDLLFFQSSRNHIVQPDEPIHGSPDLCIEVLSKTTEDVDRVDKFEQYAKGRVRHYWIVDPAKRTIETFKLVGKTYKPNGQGADDEVVRLAPFPDLDISLSDLWFPRPKRQNGKR